ncbi:hypothetical protein [Aeromicrobium sp. UC242_57]|uniref:hypothetical protein n=1 Tax=Aeromicrobium sp. UC242_57 TaxID=3374624 RepID=UPI0037B35CE4
MLGGVGAFAGTSGGDDKISQSADRNEVIARANDFAVAYNTYDVADLDDYQKRLKGLLTPKYDKQFVEVTSAIFSALKDKKQVSGEAKVLGAAIESIDADSAVAIVAVDAAITNSDNKAAVLRHFRWKISFARSNDEWLVSNFESVASVEATTEDPAPSSDPAAEGADQSATPTSRSTAAASRGSALPRLRLPRPSPWFARRRSSAALPHRLPQPPPRPNGRRCRRLRRPRQLLRPTWPRRLLGPTGATCCPWRPWP